MNSLFLAVSWLYWSHKSKRNWNSKRGNQEA